MIFCQLLTQFLYVAENYKIIVISFFFSFFFYKRGYLV